jgi:hypothetical protein
MGPFSYVRNLRGQVPSDRASYDTGRVSSCLRTFPPSSGKVIHILINLNAFLFAKCHMLIITFMKKLRAG